MSQGPPAAISLGGVSTHPTKPMSQRLCATCRTLATTGGSRCPHCRVHYRRRPLAAIAGMLVVSVLATVAGVLATLALVGQRVEREVDTRVQTVRSDVTRELARARRQLQREIGRELDERLPADPRVPSPAAP